MKKDNNKVSKIYYFPIDGQGEEIASSIPVVLKKNGDADISALPKAERECFEFFGVPDELGERNLFPKDGPLFLEALLIFSNAYCRFRSNP